MGNNGTYAIGPARLLTILAAIGLLAAGLALGGARLSGNGLTFRDVAYSHHVKLTAVVIGPATFNNGKPLPGTKYSLRKGKKKVGTWTGAPSCAGFGAGVQCDWNGTGKMKIGTLKGKVKVDFVLCSTTRPPNGIITKGIGKPGEEAVRLHTKDGCPSGKKGSKFKLTLSY